MRQSCDVLFIPYYDDLDRWHNDEIGGTTQSGVPGSRKDRMVKQGVNIDGNPYDVARFLSWVSAGDTSRRRHYDSYTLSLLSGSYWTSFLRERGHDARVAPAMDRVLMQELGEQYEPRFIFLSTTLILEMNILREAIGKIRDNWPDAILILGGLFLVELSKTLPPRKFEQTLKYFGADAYVVSPEGEQAVSQIMSRRNRESLLAEPVADTYLVNRDTGDVVHPAACQDPEASEILAAVGNGNGDENINDKWIRWDEFVPPEYMYHTVHTRTARSCAFKCSFCNFPINQGALTLMDPDVFENELRALTKCTKIRSLIFTDDTFNVPKARFKELCKVLAKFDFRWYSFFRAQFADEEVVQLMKDAGCKAVFLGIESVDDQVLKNMNKAATAEHIKKGVLQLNKAGIICHANFIVGFPGGTEATARKAVEFLDDTGIEFFGLSPWIFVPSTPIAEHREKYNIEGEWDDWKHDTMDSIEAHQLAKELALEPKYAVHSPELAGNEFWSEIMLMSNGFDVSEVQHALKTFNSFIGKDTPAEELRKSPLYAELSRILKKHPMPSPPSWG